MIGGSAGIRRQNDIQNRNDVLVYTTQTLDQDVVVTRPIILVLYDFTAKLVDVHQDGGAYHILKAFYDAPIQKLRGPRANGTFMKFNSSCGLPAWCS